MKRYAIVRVDNRCPDFFCKYKIMKDEKSFSCNDCNMHRKYGDTKEQLIKKVAQVFSMEKIIVAKTLDEYKYKLAKEIVEFLGVE